MRVRVLYHDHCFDGAASAAYFSRFIAGAFHPDAEFRYTGMAHKASQIFDPGLFDGDENAIVDFKYSSDPRLTWWFDHHQSAFLTPEDAEHFRRDRSGKKLYDPTYKSCTLFICTVAREKWGFRCAGSGQLVDWANIIDGAQYPDAKTAVELGAPGDEADAGDRGRQGLRHRAADHRLDAASAAWRTSSPSRIFRSCISRFTSAICDSIDMISERAAPGGRRRLLRPDGLRPGRLQQVHPVLPVPGFASTRYR